MPWGPRDLEAQRSIGMVLGTGGGGLAFVEEQYRTFFTEGTGSLFSITAGTHGNLSSELSIALRLARPVARSVNRMHEQHRCARLCLLLIRAA